MSGSQGVSAGIRLGAAISFALCVALPHASAADSAPASGGKGRPLPSWAAIEKTITAHFAELPDYQAGDIIARSEVAAIVEKLGKMGFSVPASEKLLDLVPDDREFLVTRLRTKDGRAFMRKISQMPMGFDRVDRLARIPRGEQTVNDLIRGPGGDELIRYMTDSRGGRNLGKQLGAVPGGRDFNEPTGRIYTAPQLVSALSKAYEAASRPTRNAKPR